LKSISLQLNSLGGDKLEEVVKGKEWFFRVCGDCPEDADDFG
jgi:hypothetical protein